MSCSKSHVYRTSAYFSMIFCLSVRMAVRSGPAGPVLAGPIIFKVSNDPLGLSFKIKFIPTKIHKTVATRAAPFGPDMHQIVCRLGFAPDPTGGAYSAPPDPLAGLRGPTSKGRGGKGKEREGRGPTSKGRGGKGGGDGRGKEGKGGRRERGRGKGGKGWPDQSQTRCYGSPSVRPFICLSRCHNIVFKRCRPIHRQTSFTT